MTLPLFMIISLATFIGSFAYSLCTSQPQKSYPAPRSPKWVESCRVAFLITTGVGFILTCLTILAAILLSIS